MKKESLNKAICSMISLPDNAVVLDIGCRNALYLNTLNQLYPHKMKRAIGIDISDRCFNQISYGMPIELKKMNCEDGLDFKDSEFDLVFVKDILECIYDKERFIKEIYRVLKPGGTVVCVNCDYDSIVFNGDNKNLISKAIHEYAITKQNWMNDIDGWMGRRTFGTFQKTGLFKGEVTMYNIIETEYKEGCYGYQFSRDIEWLTEKGGPLTSKEYCAFLKVLSNANIDGQYIFVKPYYIYMGMKIGN